MTALAQTTPAPLAPTQTYGISILESGEGPGEMLEAITENLGDTLKPWDLSRIRVPSQGGTFWTVQEMGKDKAVESVEGVIVLNKTTRAYYVNPMSDGGGAGAAPDCKSEDGKVGVGVGSGDCATCPFGQWEGDKDHRIKPKCKEQAELYLLQPEALLPTVIQVPPTSLKPWRAYLKMLSINAMPFFRALTKLTLVKVKGQGTPDYSIIEFENVGKLDKAQMETVKEYKLALQGIFENSRAAYASSQQGQPLEGELEATDLEDFNEEPPI